MSFVHLHVHTEYSLLDGACRISELVSSAKEQGQTALAITDHDCLAGTVRAELIGKRHGINVIPAVEFLRDLWADKIYTCD